MPPPDLEVVAFIDGAELVRYPVAPGRYTLGRSASCDLQINADLVSRQHALLTVGEAGALVIEDLGSSNGTFLDDEKIAVPTPFAPHQSIRLGEATLLIQQRSTGTSISSAGANGDDSIPPELMLDDRYEIGAEIAKGGMGAVLSARQPAIRRQVAMKVMLRHTSPRDRMRFIEEAQVTGQLEHPNIVPVHELGLDAHGQPFYTMKLVKGITFKKILDLLEQGVAETVAKYPLPALLTVFQKVCDALAFAHSKGVIHRDLKPANLMVGKYGEVLVMDWGLAKVIGAETNRPGAPSLEASLIGSARQEQAGAFSTMDGSVMGTPQYMSPEQANGEVATLDPRSDIYSLGAILYHLLALRPPVSGRRAAEIVEKVARGEIEPLVAAVYDRRTSPLSASATQHAASARKDGDGRRPPLQHLPGGRVPDSLAAVVRKAMSFEKGQRYASVADLQADVLAYQNGFATSAENAGAWKQFRLLIKRNKAAALGIAAVLLIGGVLGTKTVLEGRRAERALAELRKTAPTFFALSKTLVDQGKLDDALEKLGFALSLDERNPDYLLHRANLQQATQRTALAAETYRRVLALRADKSAEINFALCEKLLRDNPGSTELKRESQGELVDAMINQGRTVEAAPLSNLLGRGSETAKAAIKARLTPLATQIGPLDALIQRIPNGTFRLFLTGQPITELPPLNGLPVSEIALGNTKIADLTPLRGLQLKKLGIHFTLVTDLSPLAGMPLEDLDFDGFRSGTSAISDLTPLKGMPLTTLNAYATRVSDLTPLGGMPLRSLNVETTAVANLEPLEGMPLEKLQISNTGVADLTPLAGMPLTLLRAGNTKIRDLSPLRGMRLKVLSLWRFSGTDLSPLTGMPIEYLNLSDSKVTSLNVLRALQGNRVKLRAA